MGPLDLMLELPDRCSVKDLVQAVTGSRFLQFSSTHTTMICSVSSKVVATVFSPYLDPPREAVFCVPADSSLRSVATDSVVSFVFERV
ncbi:hypothetical protein BH11PSE13_BH11PSE13_21960 [soil metagenome]